MNLTAVGIAAAFTAALMWPLWWPFTTVPRDHIGVDRNGGDDDVVELGGRGIQPRLLSPGRYFTFGRRTIDTHELVVIPDGCLGVVTSHIGLDKTGLTAPYDTRFGCFTDVEAFLAAGGRQGVQEAVLPPGTYSIHPHAFEVIVLDNSDATYKVYGQQSSETDNMAAAEPDAMALADRTAVVIYPDSDDNHPTLAMLLVGDTNRHTCEIVKILLAPEASIRIELEVAVALGVLPNKEQIIDELSSLVHGEFDTFAVWSVAEFVAKVQAIEAAAQLSYIVRVTEAVMLPRLAAPVE